MIATTYFGHRILRFDGMSFDTASDETREAVAREAARAIPGGGSFRVLDPDMVDFIRKLILKGKITDHPPPLEPA